MRVEPDEDPDEAEPTDSTGAAGERSPPPPAERRGGDLHDRRRAEPDEQDPRSGDGLGGLIPYHNKPALIGYYCAVFSLLPCFPIGIAAVVLGVKGLGAYRRDPAVKGQVHAWIAIVLGGLMGLFWAVMTVPPLLMVLFAG